jgi:hypothetical protein
MAHGLVVNRARMERDRAGVAQVAQALAARAPSARASDSA